MTRIGTKPTAAGWWEGLKHHLHRSEYLGFHLLVGWLLSLGLLGVFLIISQTIGPESAVARWDDHIAASCRVYREASPAWRGFFLRITDLGSFRSLSLVVVCMGAVLITLRRRLLLLICLFGPMAGSIIDSSLKSWFERPRPVLHDPAVNEYSMSFPSGHSLCSLVTFGLAAYFIVQARHKHPLRWCAIPVAAVLVLLIGFSRIVLNAHYPTDVLAGWAIGGCWLATCITGVESVKIHRHARAQVSNAIVVIEENGDRNDYASNQSPSM
jgi:membrane-associated phospholipid phosphatase